MTNNFQVRLLSEQERNKSLGIMKSVFEEQKMEKLSDLDKQFWEWQNLNHPAGPSKIWIIENDDKELIAQMINSPVQLYIDGKIFNGGITIDLLVQKEYRRHGFFKKMGQQAINDLEKVGMDFQITFPRRENVHEGFVKRLNWKKIGDLPFLVKPINLDGIIKSKLGDNALTKSIAWTFKKGDKFKKLAQIRKREHKYNFQFLDRFPDSTDEIWHAFRRSCRIAVVRNKRYLDWRYIEKPNGNYSILGIFNKNQLLGFAVLKAKTIMSLQVGFIVDIMTIPQKDIIKALINEAMHYFNDEKMDLCGCIITRNNLFFKSLRQSGFYYIPVRINPRNYILDGYLKENEIDKSAFSNIKNWFITISDWDII